MKRTLKGILVALITVALVFSLVGCGGGNSPKALAKQSYDLFVIGRDGTLTPAQEQKLKELNAKVEALSEADTATFRAEIQRLMGL